MRHFASPSFWDLYEEPPATIQELADKNFELLKADPKHQSLQKQNGLMKSYPAWKHFGQI